MLGNHSYEQMMFPKLTCADLASRSDTTLVSWVVEKRPHWAVAFCALTSRYRPWVFQRCRFRLGNHHDAEDATQDIVLRALVNLHQLQDRAQIKAWLRTVVDNYCNTFAVRRAKYVNREHIEQLIEVHEQGAVAAPDAALAEGQAVQHVLSLLPAKAAHVLRLRFYGDHSLDEIADILDVTLSAAKARLYRALEQFKVLYHQQHGGKALSNGL